MNKNLFKLTFDIYEILTPSKNTSFEEAYKFSSYDTNRLLLLEESMDLLLIELEKIESDNDTDEIGYLENFKKTSNISSIDTILSDLAGYLFYFSDRWCYERYYAIKWLWNEFISILNFIY